MVIIQYVQTCNGYVNNLICKEIACLSTRQSCGENLPFLLASRSWGMTTEWSPLVMFRGILTVQHTLTLYVYSYCVLHLLKFTSVHWLE